MFRPVLPSAQRHVKLSGHVSFTVTPVDELRELRHLVQSSAISRPHRSTRRLLIAGVPCTCRGLWGTGFEWAIMRAHLMLLICFCTNNSENSYIVYRWDSRTFHSYQIGEWPKTQLHTVDGKQRRPSVSSRGKTYQVGATLNNQGNKKKKKSIIYGHARSAAFIISSNRMFPAPHTTFRNANRKG